MLKLKTRVHNTFLRIKVEVGRSLGASITIAADVVAVEVIEEDSEGAIFLASSIFYLISVGHSYSFILQASNGIFCSE